MIIKPCFTIVDGLHDKRMEHQRADTTTNMSSAGTIHNNTPPPPLHINVPNPVFDSCNLEVPCPIFGDGNGAPSTV